MGPAQSALHNRIPVEVIEDIILRMALAEGWDPFDPYLRFGMDNPFPCWFQNIRLVCQLVGEVAARLLFANDRLQFTDLRAATEFCRKIRPQTLSYTQHVSLETEVEFSDMMLWLEPCMELLGGFPVSLRKLHIEPSFDADIRYRVVPECYTVTSTSIQKFSGLEELLLVYPRHRLRYFFDGPPPAQRFVANSTPLFPSLKRFLLEGDVRCHFSPDHLAEIVSAQNSPLLQWLGLRGILAMHALTVLQKVAPLREFLLSSSHMERLFATKPLFTVLQTNHRESLQSLKFNFLRDMDYDFTFNDLWRLLETLRKLECLTIGLGRQSRSIGLSVLSAIGNKLTTVLPCLRVLQFATVTDEADLSNALQQGLLSSHGFVSYQAHLEFLIADESEDGNPPKKVACEMKDLMGSKTLVETGDILTVDGLDYQVILAKLNGMNNTRTEIEINSPLFASDEDT